ncbi:hypothetical protein M231_06549 [Tremella mesenterica]|uniref:FAD/NAD(P)-binding domain-containing protein n=1 Tax=Tremella mesenterica TaxID=5217 RepID=A0A4Q1BF40_TREME|nr:uncharacterized protein TREMEDRAFT_41890 [Tremella mesenterica DSM 1558]EIW72649.1 hypothetical protein TREMEDRAFT_41890 [Tremella mesenterica DSM 1558]RXK36205.1 hypothetical protein M231_06549 [Tremella mesenterica]
MSDVHNIVIIGASVAGHTLANSLVPIIPATHRIILVDALEFSYWPISGLRAAVVPGWEKKVLRPLTQDTVFQKDSPHRMVPGNKVIELKKGSVILEKPFEGSTELSFFKCIIATGASQPVPMRPQGREGAAEAEARLVKMQEDIKQATKVVIIGGGPVGVEMAGEIHDMYPDTSITIIHDGPALLQSSPPVPNPEDTPSPWTMPPVNPKLSKALSGLMKEIKIDVILDDRAISSDIPGEWDGSIGSQGGIKEVKLRSGKSVETDFVFLGVGNKVNVDLVKRADTGALAGSLIHVDEYLRITSTSPESPLKENYYAIGDCSSTPGWKTSQGAQADAQGLAPIIVADCKLRPAKPYKRSKMHGLFIPIGTAHGRGYVTFPLLGDVFFPEFMVKKAKGTDLFFTGGFLKLFQGAESVE